MLLVDNLEGCFKFENDDVKLAVEKKIIEDGRFHFFGMFTGDFADVFICEEDGEIFYSLEDIQGNSIEWDEVIEITKEHLKQ